ncbi:MAG: 2-oxo acid dehydrogenase subunit E2 [Chloroflexi bacterium CFX4]|nr:2-oxo acid dehydrogenase subunit E2 [Chloroflexi bacterium CFX4]MDL1924081.1 2-oxo acid dehydrogenase subunit E2 [Chloroflexi bacterium CFX3]
MPTNVIMPQLGESVVEGTLSRWLKQVGERVEEFEPIAEVTTDKVDTEIPAPASGVVLAIHVAEGETVERGTLLAVIGQPNEQVATAPSAPPAQAHAANGQSVVVAATPPQAAAQRYSPVVARMAAEHNLDLARIHGTGLGGRVTKKDVEAYLAAQTSPPAAPLAPWEQPGGGDLFKPTDEIYAAANAKPVAAAPQPSAVPRPAAPQSLPPSTAPDGTLVPHSAIRRSIAKHMVESKLHTAPHVTTVFEVDMARTMAHWKANEAPFAAQGVRLTLTAYFVAAVVRAAQAQPTLNSRWTDDGLLIPPSVNVGMAVALQDGLIVPVIKNAQDLNLVGLARQVTDLATRARAKQLKPDDLQGGTITLTNHGVSGSLFATPIINQPQSAIVGVGAVTKRPVVITDADGNDMLAIRPMLYATLTFDHRVADGALGDAFMRVFKDTLENWS